MGSFSFFFYYAFLNESTLPAHSSVGAGDTLYEDFVVRQRQVDAHLSERRAWECGGECGRCEVEYKAVQTAHSGVVWRNGSRDGECEIECQALGGVSVETTMENTGCWLGGVGRICGNTRRASDVHMQYYSWADVDFMRGALSWHEKTSFIASFISNCGGGDRLEWMAALKLVLAERNETRVYNYGGCNRDAEELLAGAGATVSYTHLTLPTKA